MKKLIVIKPNGNHSNRLIQNLYFEVFCKEYNIEFRNPTFNDLSKYYVNPCNSSTNAYYKFLQVDLLGKIFRHSRFVKRVFSTVWLISKVSFLKFVRFDKENEESLIIEKLLRSFKRNNTVYVGGWWFNVPILLEKHKDSVIQNYALKNEYYQENTLVNKVEQLKNKDYTLIGVHIRRGDYKTWKGGKYYFEDDVFEANMNQISKELISKGKHKHVFILFSNEELKFTESDNIIISQNDWYIDHYIMSQCDYLIGPLSTFTLWATLIGNAKYVPIQTSISDTTSILSL